MKIKAKKKIKKPKRGRLANKKQEAKEKFLTANEKKKNKQIRKN